MSDEIKAATDVTMPKLTDDQILRLQRLDYLLKMRDRGEAHARAFVEHVTGEPYVVKPETVEAALKRVHEIVTAEMRPPEEVVAAPEHEEPAP